MSKYIVSIGGFSHEGLITNVKALGYEILPLKLEDVTPRTWLKRIEIIDRIIESDELAATIIYLHTTLLLQASKNEYSELFSEIIGKVTQFKTIVFIFQDNLDGIFAMRDRETRVPLTLKQLEELLDKAYYYHRGYMDDKNLDVYDKFREVFNEVYEKRRLYNYDLIECAVRRLKDYENRKAEVEGLIESIYNSGVDIAPFYIRSDVTIRLQEFLNDIEQSVFLRLFVSNERFQADQLKSLLSVLERYLRQVEGQNFSIDSQKSNKGIIYIFRTQSICNLQSLNNAFVRFDSFMRLCGDQPDQAQKILIQQGISEQESLFLVERYSKDYKRLIIDMVHEFELKGILLKQKFETDLIEQGGQPVALLKNQNLSNIISAIATGGNITVNVSNMLINNTQQIHNEAKNIINGDVICNKNDKKIIELISKYADGLEALQCHSDLEQLKDNSIDEPKRRNSKQRLLSFLKKAARKTIDIAEKAAIEGLSLYIGSLLTGPKV